MTKREQISVVAWAVCAPQSKQIGAMRGKLRVRQRLRERVCPLSVGRHLADVDDAGILPRAHCEVPRRDVARRIPLRNGSGCGPLESAGIIFV